MQQPNEATTEIEQTQPQEEQAAAETEQAQPQEEKTTAKMSIASIFTGDKNAKLEKCKYGIIGTLKDYASKNRRVYLEKTTDGFNEIKLCSGIATYNSEELDYKQLENKQDLSKEQICRLQNHVNAMGITMNDYLTQVGFDTSNLKQEGKT